MQTREPPFRAGFHVHVLVHAFGDILDAAQPANRIGVGRRKRRRGSQSRFGVAEPLARRRMIVLFHRVVFGMEGDANYRSFSVLGSPFSVLNEERRTENGERRTIPLVMARRRLDGPAEVIVYFWFVVPGR